MSTVVDWMSAGLNAGGVAVLLLRPDMDYRLAWAVTRFVVFATWNYPLLRDHVVAGHLSSPDLPSRDRDPVDGPVSLGVAGEHRVTRA